MLGTAVPVRYVEPPMEGLLENAAIHRNEREPWVELAAELKRRGDVRGELADIQLALEDARGTEHRDLLLAEERLLNERAAELWGPLAEVGPKHPGNFLWKRGFLDSIVVPGATITSHQGQRTRTEPLPREILSRACEHDVARLSRYMMAWRKPRRAPTWIDRLDFAQVVLTRDVMALPMLRALSAWTLVSSVPLRHPTLEHLGLACKGPTLELLESAELPGLKSLYLTNVTGSRADLARIAQAIARLAPEKLLLAVDGAYGPNAWTADDLRALEPIAGRLEGLALRLPIPPIDFQLPRLRRLNLSLSASFGSVDFGAKAPALPPVEELSIRIMGRFGIPDTIAAVRESAALRGARVLQLEGMDASTAEIVGRPLERLEELAVMAMGTMNVGFSDAILKKDSFPKVRTLSLAMSQQLPGLALSPLAPRIETLSLELRSPRDVAAWRDAREKLPNLRTLVVRGLRAFDAATRATLHDGGHEVIWARTNAEALRSGFEGTRMEPGFSGVF